MTNTRSMTRNQTDEDASSRKRFKTCDNSGATPWSDLNHDVLFLVMMQLGVIDFVAFSGVCKPWRTLALPNKKRFMASRPPMSISISSDSNSNEKELYLEDCEGRKFKTLLPHSAGRDFVGLTCGYVVLFEQETKDFWVVNPITRHQLHFPTIRCPENVHPFKATIVFSQIINRWVFVVLHRFPSKIWVSIEGKGAWNYITSTSMMIDLVAFKGKIYTLDTDWRVCEMRLNPEPKLTLLEIKNFPKQDDIIPMFVSWDENLYVMDYTLNFDLFQELDFDEMKVSPKEDTIEEYVFFLSHTRNAAVFKLESWAGSWSQYEKYDCFLWSTDQSLKGRFFGAIMWYFPHRCLNVDLVTE